MLTKTERRLSLSSRWTMLSIVAFLATGSTANATNFSFTQIDMPGALYTTASGINDAGQIVGSFADGRERSHGFLYTSGGFTHIDPPGTSGTSAYGINDAGQIVGFFTVRVT